MKNSKLKNSIILRGMSSNIVDEAIVILKPNVKIKSEKMNKKLMFKDEKIEKKLVLEEAEHVILEYIEKINQKQLQKQKDLIERNNKLLKIVNIILTVVCILAIFR